MLTRLRWRDQDAGIAVLALAFSWFKVPETNGRSLEQIQQELGAPE